MADAVGNAPSGGLRDLAVGFGVTTVTPSVLQLPFILSQIGNLLYAKVRDIWTVSKSKPGSCISYKGSNLFA